jgi:hypothetical protein
MANTLVKYAADQLDYGFDWSDFLKSGDIIANAIISSPLLTVGSTTVDQDGFPIAFISGGVTGQSYPVTCTIYTVSGLIANSTFTLQIGSPR